MKSSNIESFLESVWEKKFWVISRGIFCASIVFLISFYMDFPNQQENFKKFELFSQQFISDSELVQKNYLNFKQTLASLDTASQDISEITKQIVSARNSSNNIDLNSEITQRLKSITNCRSQFSESVGIIRGTKFQSDLFSDFFKGYDEDLQIFEAFLSTYDQFVLAYISNNKDSLPEITETLTSYSPKLLEAGNALVARSNISTTRLENISKEFTTRVEENKGKFGILTWQIIISAIAMIYIEIFLIFAFSRWKSHGRNSKKRKSVSTDLLGKLENYTERVASKKIWIIASIIFLACFYFVIDLVAKSPEVIAQMERQEAKRQIYAQDLIKIQELNKRIQSWGTQNTKSLGEVTNLFSSIFEKHNVNINGFIESYKLTVDARKETAITIGMIRGISFHSDLFSEIVSGFETSFREYDSGLEAIEKFYVLLGAVNLKTEIGKATFKKEIQQISKESEKMQIASSTLVLLRTGMNQKINNGLKIIDVEIEKDDAVIDRFIIKGLLFFPATLYIIVFTIILIRSWWRHHTLSKA